MPWRLDKRAICCFAYFLLSLLLIDLAFVAEICMGLTQSCYVTEGFGMVLLPLLQLLYGPLPVATIRRPTAWLCQLIIASTSAYTAYTPCNPLDQGGQPFSVCVPKSAKSMTKFFCVPTKNCGEGSEFWAPVAAFPPNLGVWSAADTALFAAIWHQST